MPKISVIIPVHNTASFLTKCLSSLVAQTFRDFEVVVVDDASTDGSAELASGAAQVISSPRNIGAGAARNLGVRAARGEIVAFIDADAVAHPQWLERMVKQFEDQEIKCVGGGYSGSGGDSFWERFAFRELAYRRKDFPEYVSTLVSNNFACDKKAFWEVGGFTERHPFTVEDLVFSFVLSRKYPIRWDKDNGVLHHFRDSLAGYLKQQYRYARDTVWAYYCYPRMSRVKTHQGKQLYWETMLTGGAVIGGLWHPGTPLFFAAVLLVMNLNFLGYLSKHRLPPLKSFATILLRNLAGAGGVIMGLIACAADLACRGGKYLAAKDG